MPEEKNFGLNISNRSGNLVNSEHKIAPLTKSLNAKCNYPAYTFFIDYNGDVLMCSHDWGKKNILGNLNKNTLIEIWTSQLSKVSRKKRKMEMTDIKSFRTIGKGRCPNCWLRIGKDGGQGPAN